jgi:alpha-aminoadipate carrier protein LysW
MATLCPECDTPLHIDVDEVDAGEVMTCEECGTELEILSVDPVEVAPVEIEGYDDEDLVREEEDEEDA